jgi:hypothetical protein
MLYLNKTTLLILLLFTNLIYPQIIKEDIEYRHLKGQLIDEYGRPFPGQTVIIKGTNIGVSTNFTGNFCLTIPKNKSVFIELPFCFDQIFREIKPNDKEIRLQIGKEKWKKKKAIKKWNKLNTILKTEYIKIYSSEKYKIAQRTITCE